jgi:hypothetical protein
MPLFQTCQFGARGGVLFADGGGLPFQLLQFLPLGFQGRFALGAQSLFLFDGGAVFLALFYGFLRIAPPPFQFQTRDG